MLTPREPEARLPLALGLLVVVLGGGVLAFSQTGFSWGDEGFQLLAAQLIARGLRPYRDFFYQQAPLYALVHAAWLASFGGTWRASHVLSALMTGASIWLATGFVFSSLPDARWRRTAGASTALILGLDYQVIKFGGIGQAYGLCLLLCVAAFRLTIGAARRASGTYAVGAGLMAGAAANASLLAAPVGPISLAWLVARSGGRDRQKISLGFVAGVLASITPLLWFWASAPQAVLFDVFEFHVFHRSLVWGYPDILRHNLGQVTSWLDSAQGVLLVLLAGLGVISLLTEGEWDPQKRAEFLLCGWLAGGLTAYLCVPRPTFAQYFILVAPFAAILASLGVVAVASRVMPAGRGMVAPALLLSIFALGLTKSVYLDLTSVKPTWREIEAVAREVDRVTAPEEAIFSDEESIYFAARRRPLPGMEFLAAQDLNLPAVRLSRLHVMPRSEIERGLADASFGTVAISSRDPRIQALDLPRAYPHCAQVGRYLVFWKGSAPTLQSCPGSLLHRPPAPE